MKKGKIINGTVLSISFAIVCFIGCHKPDTIPTEAQGNPNLPGTPYGYMNKHNVNDNLATLGRVLFYDKNMSVNNTVSCGSCHKQEYAFANNVRFDKGFNGLELKRNSPSIQGIVGFSSQSFFPFGSGDSLGIPNENNQTDVLLFWDGRQRSLADMVLNPVTNHNEMSMPDFTTLVNRLNSSSYYPDLFEKAYGDKSITKERIAFALEGFISCLNTETQRPIVNLTPLEQQGKNLFHNKYNCAKCHDQNNVIDPRFPFDSTTTGGNNNGSNPYAQAKDPSQMFNIGLDEVYTDQGLGKLTGMPGDNGIFKVPTLQNISVTAPYMHDGRFANLSEVLDHYSHQIKPNSNLSPLFKNIDGTPKDLNISPVEKVAIIAFLNTLKDEDFLTSPMYSDPFKK